MNERGLDCDVERKERSLCCVENRRPLVRSKTDGIYCPEPVSFLQQGLQSEYFGHALLTNNLRIDKVAMVPKKQVRPDRSPSGDSLPMCHYQNVTSESSGSTSSQVTGVCGPRGLCLKLGTSTVLGSSWKGVRDRATARSEVCR